MKVNKETMALRQFNEAYSEAVSQALNLMDDDLNKTIALLAAAFSKTVAHLIKVAGEVQK